MELQASPTTVWAALEAVAAWSAWNPVVRDVAGAPIAGAPVRWSLDLGVTTPCRGTWVDVVPGRRLAWRGSAVGLEVEHAVTVEPAGLKRSRVAVVTRARGPVVSLLVGPLSRRFEATSVRFLDALERRLRGHQAYAVPAVAPGV